MRLAALGVGNELHVADAGGVQLLRQLQRILPPSDHLLLLEGGTAPENQTGALRRFTPDIILILDVADLTSPQQVVRVLRPEQADGFSGSTHSLPLSMLAQYLQQELDCLVRFIALQPALDQDTIETIAADVLSILRPYLPSGEPQ